MKQSNKRGVRNEIGAIGEDIAGHYLERSGHTIVDTNYFKKWGEIDIVSRETINNEEIIHFVEVKTVSYETKDVLQGSFSHETYRPEEKVNPEKLKRMHRTIESWLLHNGHYGEWQLDVIVVKVVSSEKYATVKYLPNVIV